jgi:hypothetical protein
MPIHPGRWIEKGAFYFGRNGPMFMTVQYTNLLTNGPLIVIKFFKIVPDFLFFFLYKPNVWGKNGTQKVHITGSTPYR